MLLTMRAFVEGARALAAWIALEIDHAETQPRPGARARQADDLVALLTPIVKAFLTDLGFETTNLGVQVLGGHGYIREYGMEQFVRDARITQIYEGTNGIQALDLVGRKLPAHMRAATCAASSTRSPSSSSRGRQTRELAEFVVPLAKAFERLQRATAWLAQRGHEEPRPGRRRRDRLPAPLRLHRARLPLGAHGEGGAGQKQGGDDAAFYEAKLATARFYMQRMLPRSGAHFATLMAGSAPIMDFPEAAF